MAFVTSMLPAAAVGGQAPRIRTLDASLAELLSTGYARSPTLRRIVDRLEEADVIVHVDVRRLDSPGIAGMLQFVTHAAGYRYLRVTIAAGLSPGAAIMMLGHELQHAVEVADDASVVDGATFGALYGRIGDGCQRRGGVINYDTRAARDAGEQVLAEMHHAAARVARRPPRHRESSADRRTAD
jgi:hypothetical protein